MFAGDITSKNGLGVANSKLLAHLFKIQPEAVKLYLYVRTRMRTAGLADLKGYTMCLLVIYYLQTKNLMPTIEMVQRGLPKKIVDSKYNSEVINIPETKLILFVEWNIEFNPSRTLDNYQTNVLADYRLEIKGFFAFYQDRNFDLVMSPHSGKVYTMQEYLTTFPKFQKKSLNIAGPINQESNCGEKQDKVLRQFVEICKATVSSPK